MKRLALIGLFLFVGCGGFVPIDLSTPKEEQARPVYETNYKIGEQQTAFVGQEIVRVKSFNARTEIPIKGVAKSKEKISVHAIYSLSYCRLESEANKEYPIGGIIQIGGKKYKVVELNEDWGVLIGDDGIVLNNVIYNLYRRVLYYPSYMSVTPGVFEVSQKCAEEKYSGRTPGLSFELIYSGKNDISMNATYREYTPDDFARPAFFQNITYQADAKQIRFKNFVIRIEDVTNEKITYTVIEDGLK